jgi:hypothetical protein
MDKFEIIVEKFEKFIKRSIVPSSSFILFLLIFDIIFYQHKIIDFLDKEHSSLTLWLLVIGFFGLANLLSILNQALYDNFLKANFNGLFPWKNENSKLNKLRDVVNKVLNMEENDYMLYKNIAKGLNTEESTNQAKSFGIMFVSLMIVTLIGFYLSFYKDASQPILPTIILFLTLAIEYYIGKELVKSRYRSRAIKLYTNFINDKA